MINDNQNLALSQLKTININFGTDGYRGIIADNFTFEKVSLISASFGSYLVRSHQDLHLPAVAVGYDTRFLSKEFALVCAKALSNKGIKVVLSDGYCPSPVLSFTIKKRFLSAGVMITASHNPYMYNGIKFKSAYGSSMLFEDVKEIENIANSSNDVVKDYGGNIGDIQFYNNANSNSGGNAQKNIIYADLKTGYIDHVIKFTGIDRIDSALFKNLEVIIDPMYGAGIGFISSILDRFSIKNSCINNEVNPLFPGINPEPAEENLGKLIDLTKKKGEKNKFAVGFATDGDADRIGAVDETGNFIDSHKIFTLLLNFLLEEGFSGEVVKTVSVSKSIDRICAKYKLKLHEVPVGFKNIARLMIQPGGNILIGGEESGGIGITSHMPERDGIFNAIMLLKVMLLRKKPLSKLINGIFGHPYPYVYKRCDIYLDAGKKEKLIKDLKNGDFQLPFKENIALTNFMDGFKFEYKDNSWLLVRASGTEPLLRIYAESSDKDKTAFLIDRTISLIEKY